MTAKTAEPKATEGEMVDLIRRRYCTVGPNGPAAVLIPQVRNAAGFDASRTADALVMQLWPSRGLHLEGFEVKCSRSDVLKELRQPEKAEAIARYCEKWWLVLADPSFIKDDELPEPWGLLVRRSGKLHAVKNAPVRDVPGELPKTFLAALLRQADRESLRPTEEALRAEYQRGVEEGRQSSGYATRQLDELNARVKAFQEASGVDLSFPPDQLAAAARVMRLMVGARHHSWDGLLPRLERLSKEADGLVGDLRASGLLDDPDESGDGMVDHD